MAKFTADFETTTDENDCRVWAWATCNIENEKMEYGIDIDSFMKMCARLGSSTMYFHNLKFDGEFILYWLFENGFEYSDTDKPGTFKTLISDMSVFYTIEIIWDKVGKNVIKTKLIDSLKVIPMSVSDAAKAFGLSISKLEIDYHETRAIGHELTEQEKEYIKNDVLIIARALNILHAQNMTKLTTGANALKDFKSRISKRDFERKFPVLDIDMDKEIRMSYKGGFTYAQEKYQEKDIGEGIVLDVNSLYPSVMYYNKLPFGAPMRFEGKYKEDKIYDLYVQIFTCAFSLKKEHLPTIQIKSRFSHFLPTEYVKTTNGEHITMCLTSVDLELFFEHYNVYDIEYHSGYKFKSTVGMFKDYIDYWMGIKVQATKDGNKGMRSLAKLMLNSLYGKFSVRAQGQSKIPVYEDGMVKYKLGEEEERKLLYIPVGTFITAWARYKTITSAQKVYDRFLYADTDSLHLMGKDIPEGLEVDDTKLGAWKHESTFTRARFLRAKSYVEEIDGKLEVTCAGMPDRCHAYVTWDNFRRGSKFAGKLNMTHVMGGIILKDIDFTIK